MCREIFNIWIKQQAYNFYPFHRVFAPPYIPVYHCNAGGRAKLSRAACKDSACGHFRISMLPDAFNVSVDFWMLLFLMSSKQFSKASSILIIDRSCMLQQAVITVFWSVQQTVKYFMSKKCYLDGISNPAWCSSYNYTLYNVLCNTM